MYKLFIFCGLLNMHHAMAQTGGSSAYSFLDLVTSARIASLGGKMVPVKDNDINLAFQNPSLLNDSMHGHLALNFVDYFSDINYGSVIYSHTLKKSGSLSAGIQYINYGVFTESDVAGTVLGEFRASDYLINIGWGNDVNVGRFGDSLFSVGGNLKLIYSSLHEYSSFGAALDLAGTYHNSKERVTATVMIRNIGRQFKSYRRSNAEPLPFEIIIGASKKLKHAPLRILLTAQHLEKWDLTYTDPAVATIDALTGEEIINKISFGDKMMRHVVAGGEILLTQNFNIRFGYNYQRRKELQAISRKKTVGFSWGLGFRIYRFHISYSRSSYHLAGSPNFFSITTDLGQFYNKTLK